MKLAVVCAFVFSCLWASSSAFKRTARNDGSAKLCGSRSVRWMPEREPRIIGGEVPPVGAVPWQIDLRQGANHHCGGALISTRLILSAAHCFSNGLTAVAGAHGPPGSSPFEQILEVERFIPHPDFRKLGPYSHDMALVVTVDPGFVMNNLVTPACFSLDSPQPGTWCEVSGWGATDPLVTDRISTVLRAAAVPVLSMDKCRTNEIYGGRPQQILDSMLCAGHLRGGTDACGGDSGGPLMCEMENGNMEVMGIVSWGEGCAKKNKPGVYTRVSNFVPWVKEVAQELGLDEGL